MLRTGLILAVAVLIGSAFVHGWISAWFRPSAEQLSNQQQRVTAVSGHMGKAVSVRFARLNVSQQRAIRANLQQQLLPVNAWLDGIARAQPQVLCFGEDHEQSTRRFLAEKIFPRLNLDVLMLETTPTELQSILQAMHTKQSFVPLEGANISAVISAARNKNPDILLAGIEETESQRVQRIKNSKGGFRDDTLAVNLGKQIQPGKRHALIFGALHCQDDSNWLFAQMRQATPERLRDSLLNIRVLGEFQNESLQAMLYFLNEIGLTQGDFVIPDTRQLDPEFKQWFPLLAPTLRDYQTLLVFRTANYLQPQ